MELQTEVTMEEVERVVEGAVVVPLMVDAGVVGAGGAGGPGGVGPVVLVVDWGPAVELVPVLDTLAVLAEEEVETGAAPAVVVVVAGPADVALVVGLTVEALEVVEAVEALDEAIEALDEELGMLEEELDETAVGPADAVVDELATGLTFEELVVLDDTGATVVVVYPVV